MREILFRGFHPCDGPDTIVVDGEKVKGRWVEGYFVKADGRINNGKCFILENAADFSFGDGGNRIRIGCFIEVLPSTVCQYTGLTDKNGKKIFEGDNVYDPRENSIYTVEWNENNAIFQMAHDWRRRSVETAYYCEIIGNIYDGEGDND